MRNDYSYNLNFNPIARINRVAPDFIGKKISYRIWVVNHFEIGCIASEIHEEFAISKETLALFQPGLDEIVDKVASQFKVDKGLT